MMKPAPMMRKFSHCSGGCVKQAWIPNQRNNHGSPVQETHSQGIFTHPNSSDSLSHLRSEVLMLFPEFNGRSCL